MHITTYLTMWCTIVNFVNYKIRNGVIKLIKYKYGSIYMFIYKIQLFKYKTWTKHILVTILPLKFGSGNNCLVIVKFPQFTTMYVQRTVN